MYKCMVCGEVFEKPNLLKERHGEVDTRDIETFSVCPVCGNDDLAEVHECPTCGVNYTEYEYCSECEKDMDLAIQSLLEEFANTHQCEYEKAKELFDERIEQI